MRQIGLLVLAAGSGCAMGLGASVEASGGVIHTRPTLVDTGVQGETEWAMTAGLSFNVEFDENRDANLVAGFGPQMIRPSSGGRDVVAVPMVLSYGGSVENLGWRIRPRGYFGFALERDEDPYFDVHMGLGGSIHPAQGWAVHISAGPQFVIGTSQEFGEDEVSYRGLGGQVRLRIFRMLSRKCDPVQPTSGRHPC